MTRQPKIEPLGGDTPFDGSQFSVRVERFRHADGEEVQREYVHRMAAAAIVAYDDEHVWLVRQPREAILQYTLELPAGKLDAEAESALQTAQRELAEEIGQAAEHWTQIACYPSLQRLLRRARARLRRDRAAAERGRRARPVGADRDRALAARGP
jgi:8-oxo-dGTP pyrophosphatase MutT (NUDIX family)